MPFRIFAFRQNQKNPYFVHTKSMQPWPIGLIFRHLCCLPNPPTNTKPPSTDLAQHLYKRSREFSARRHHHRPSYHYGHQRHETTLRGRPLVMAGAFVRPLRSTPTASTTTRWWWHHCDAGDGWFGVTHVTTSSKHNAATIRWIDDDVLRWFWVDNPLIPPHTTTILSVHFATIRRCTEEVQKTCWAVAPSGKT